MKWRQIPHPGIQRGVKGASTTLLWEPHTNPSPAQQPNDTSQLLLGYFLKALIPFNTVRLGTKISMQECIRKTYSSHNVGLNKRFIASQDITKFPSSKNGCKFYYLCIMKFFPKSYQLLILPAAQGLLIHLTCFVLSINVSHFASLPNVNILHQF